MKLVGLLISAVALGACGDDASPSDASVETSREFQLRIENIAPWIVLKAGTQTTKTDLVDGRAGPGEAFEIRFTANASHRLSFATMLVESNDWFFAPGPTGIPLYVDGRPLSGDITEHVRLWDAGTETDQEPGVGIDTALHQLMRNAGALDPDNRIREVAITTQLTDGTTFVRPPINELITVTLTPGLDQQFTLRITNASTATTLVTSQGAFPVHLSPFAWAIHDERSVMFEAGAAARDNGFELLAEAGQPDSLGASLRLVRGFATPLSPGVFVIHRGTAPLFAPGNPDYGAGLERLAEDGDHRPLRDALAASLPAGGSAAGVFETPVGADAPGPALPGQRFEVIVRAEPGDALSFVTMFGMSNDWFFSTPREGIALFDRDIPRSCDVTTAIQIYDLGTEIDEELDVGPNTAPRQPAPDSGRPDRTTAVREVGFDRYSAPPVLHLRVTLTPL